MTAELFAELVVNGETVPRAVIAAEAQNHVAPKGKPGFAWRKAANAVAVRALLLQEAHRRGFRPSPVETGPGRYETDEEALVRELLDVAVDNPPPTDDELRAEWARDPSRFRSPPLWEVSHVLCACDPRDESQTRTAHARAVDLTGRVLGNPRDFPTIAREYSDCGSKSSGGMLGQLGPGDTVPEFESALRGLSEGEITTEPVLTRHGWHIIRMDAVAHGEILPFEAVRQKISDAMEKASWAARARTFVTRLVADSDISGACWPD